jgi:hypothetical protein
MKLPMLIVGAALVLLTDRAVPKDRGALMLYHGRDSVISIIPQADSANLALIMLRQWTGDPVAPAQLAGRSCLGVALFSKAEWATLMASGRTPEQIRPAEASMRLRVYPPTATAPAATQDISTRDAWVAIAFQEVEKSSVTWSVKTRAEKTRGPCTAE